MQLAILGDIHGNIRALEAVLADVRRRRVDQVIVNGDLVNRGPCNIAVLERLWDRGYSFTLGNHDDLMCKWVDRDPAIPRAWFDDPFWQGTNHIAAELQSGGWIEVIRHFPMTHEIDLDGAPTLLIAHGSPRHYREGYARFTPNHVLNEIVATYEADIFIGSHTHRPASLEHSGHLFLNTGAVGAPFNRDPRAQFLLMTLQQQRWQAEICYVEYDRDAAIADFTRTGYLNANDLAAHIFREELIYACPLFDPFWRWVEKEAMVHSWEAWEEFRRLFPERFQPLP